MVFKTIVINQTLPSHYIYKSEEEGIGLEPIIPLRTTGQQPAAFPLCQPSNVRIERLELPRPLRSIASKTTVYSNSTISPLCSHGEIWTLNPIRATGLKPGVYSYSTTWPLLSESPESNWLIQVSKTQTLHTLVTPGIYCTPTWTRTKTKCLEDIYAFHYIIGACTPEQNRIVITSL